MIRSLYTAATGMMAQQQQIDVTSNNIANVNTTGFKKGRAEYEDLMYQNLNYASNRTSEETKNPVGIQVGLGTKISAITKLFSQGSLKETGNNLDMAIAGSGFFKVMLPSGEYGYTRSGEFKVDENGSVVTSQGYKIDPEMTFPDGATKINISKDGIVSSISDTGTQTDIGQIQLVSFLNPAGLNAIGGNMYMRTENSGDPVDGVPGINGIGTIQQGFVEASNVQLVTEMTDLITGQRAYEANSKSVKTVDEMLQTINNLKQ